MKGGGFYDKHLWMYIDVILYIIATLNVDSPSGCLEASTFCRIIVVVVEACTGEEECV